MTKYREGGLRIDIYEDENYILVDNRASSKNIPSGKHKFENPEELKEFLQSYGCWIDWASFPEQ